MGWVGWVYNWAKGAGWLETAEGKWCQELCGTLMNGTASGGPLDELETQTGRSYPGLQIKRQACVDTYLAWADNPWWQIWKNPELGGAYKAACESFATTLDAAMAEATGPAGTPGIISDWIKKNWKILTGVGVIAALGIGIAVAARRK